MEVNSMKLKLRFLAGGTIIFLLGLALGALRGYGPGYELLMGGGIVFLLLGLFWKDKPQGNTGSHPGPA
jgi:hypothetical protein